MQSLKEGRVFPEQQIQSQNIMYKCTASPTSYPKKVYSGTAEDSFKKRFYNHKQSFNNKFHANDTSLSKYIWKINSNHHITSALTGHIVKSVPS